MTFIWPSMLLLLIVVPLLVVVYIRMQQRRQRLIASYSSSGLVSNATSKRSPGIRRHIPPLIFLCALTLLIFSLARPQMIVSLPRLEGTVVLAFDVSGSMVADDLKPTRMDAAKAAAKSFVDQQPPNVPIGIVAFSDSGIAVQVPTTDRDEVLAAINRLSPQRSTALASGMLAAINTLLTGSKTSFYSNRTPTPSPSPTPMPKGTYGSGVIVLLTDGENNQQPDPLSIAQVASDRGIRIYTVGIGSPTGTNLKVDGFTIHTQLEEAVLEAIASSTGGTYYNAQSTDQLRSIYGNLNPQLVVKAEKQEVTYLLAGMSIVLLLVGSTFSLWWLSRLP
jgi:Ca-activated chloride channel family protein